ncbi:MAG: thiamine-phosphate kinase, partial [Nitrospiraceae bacterium]
QSGVGAEIETSALPLSPACRAYAAASRLDPVRLALTGGEDYELLFSISSGSRAKLERLARLTGCHFARIGTVRPKRAGVRLRRVNGSSKRLAIAGYQHFQDPRTIPHEAAWSR